MKYNGKVIKYHSKCFHEHENGENYKLFFDAIENLSNDTDVENALHPKQYLETQLETFQGIHTKRNLSMIF